MAVGTTDDLVVRLVVDLNRFTTGFKKATNQIKTYSKKVTQFSRDHQASFKRAGVAAAAFAGTMAFAFKKGVSVALEYEEQLARVETMLRDNVDTAFNEVTGNMEIFDKEVRKASVTFAQSTDTLTDSLFSVLSAGKSVEEGLEIMTAAATVAAGQFAETGDVTNVLLTVLETYGDETLDAARATDMLSNTVFLARTTMAAMAPQLGRIIPIAKQLGISFADMQAIFAQLTLSLGGTEQATTSLAAVMNAFLKPSEKAKEIFADITEEISGYRAELSISTIEQIGFEEMLRLIAASGKENAVQFFENQRALRALNTILTKTNEIMEKSKFITEETGTALDLYNRRAEKTEFQLKQTEKQIKLTMVDAFNTALPTLKSMAESLRDLLTWFADLDKATKGIAGPTLLWGFILSGISAVILGIIALLPSLATGVALIAAEGAGLLLFAGVFTVIAVEIWAIIEVVEVLRLKFKEIDEWMQVTIKFWDEFLGLDFGKPVAHTADLEKRLKAVNKQHGIQAKSLEEALALIREKNKSTEKGSIFEIEAAKQANKSLEEQKSLIEKIKGLKAEKAKAEDDKDAKKAAKLAQEILNAEQEIHIERLFLLGMEREARLAELQIEHDKRKELLGDNVKLEELFILKKQELDKEIAANEAIIIEEIKFSWAGYYDWKKDRIAEEVADETKGNDDIEAAERLLQERLKKLDTELVQFKIQNRNNSIKVLKKSLREAEIANEEFYANVEELALLSGKTRGDIIANYAKETEQSFSDVWEGIKAGAEETANAQVNFFAEGQNIVKNGHKQMVDGMSTVFADFIEGSIRGNANLTESFNKFAESMAQSFIQAVSRMIVKALVLKVVQASIGSPIGFESGGLVPEFANGGFVPGFANGGPVFGNAGPGDNVNAKLKGGEFIVKNDSVTSDTARQLSAINRTGKPVAATVPSVNNNIVNFVDPNLFQNYITKNPDAIVNVVSADAASGGKTRSGLRRTL